ncbi:MAG: HD domain-containing protein [Acidobacteria bacterium]|nr:HD domain-containing protein [Acidobacteriota bacterium]
MSPGDDFRTIVESRYPGLIDRVRDVIQESERSFEGRGNHSESFLWEHTLHAASIALQLAKAEGVDPSIPVIAALFHDAGKFAGGRYHSDDTAEEEESARIAREILGKFGMKPAAIRQVMAGLRALYNEKARKNSVAAIIHDADFLSKFGALGVASFFIKSALRRRTLRSALLGYLSKELTYASCLPLNMHTSAGRKLASRKSSQSIKFFRSLLAELRDSQIADLSIRRLRVPNPSAGNGFLTIQVVVSPACPRCGTRWKHVWTTEKGVKCHKLIVEWTCSRCAERVDTSFCLPEVTG